MFSLIKKGVVIKLGWVWSERFENRFILKEGGSSIIKWRQNAKKSIFHNFHCIRKSKKGVAVCRWFPNEFWLEFFWLQLLMYRSNHCTLFSNYLRKTVFWTSLLYTIKGLSKVEIDNVSFRLIVESQRNVMDKWYHSGCTRSIIHLKNHVV